MRRLKLFKRSERSQRRLKEVRAFQHLLILSEIFIRHQVRDDERLAVLLKRAPKQRFTEQIRLSHDHRMGRKSVGSDLANVSANTPKEKLWRHLVEAGQVIDQENLCH